MMYYRKFDTEICQMIIVGSACGISQLHLAVDDSNRELKIEDDWVENNNFFDEEIAQIKAYINGQLKTFDIKLNLKGTSFQKHVWKELVNIPYGETVSYKDIAIRVGKTNGSRAVGMANGKNPIPLIIPCHRVIGSNGNLTGYAFGLDIKIKLLGLEEKHKMHI